MTIREIQPDDFAVWLPLWEGYNAFYKRTVAIATTETTWRRFLDPAEPVHALVADDAGQLLGLVHYLFHRHTALVAHTCYLQDLFTAETARGKGIGRALIRAVNDKAREAGSPQVYWLTHETNQTARSLYDTVARNSGFIVYSQKVEA